MYKNIKDNTLVYLGVSCISMKSDLFSSLSINFTEIQIFLTVLSYAILQRSP